MIKLKNLLKENVGNNIRFEKDDTIMFIDTQKGTYRASVFSFIRNGIIKYNFDVSSPPEKYVDYQIQGKTHRMAQGGQLHLGKSGTNVEQIYAQLAEKLKELGLPYTQSSKLKVLNIDTPERREFIEKLKAVAASFNKKMEDPENQPKPFGKGPPAFGQWISATDVTSNRLKWVVDNYGDFWIVLKWGMSPREIKKASEIVKHYDKIMSGKIAAGDYCREMYVKDNPFEGI